jgi:hypothetical protein
MKETIQLVLLLGALIGSLVVVEEIVDAVLRDHIQADIGATVEEN